MSQGEGTTFVTPYGGLEKAPTELHPAEMRVVEHPDGTLEVHDPSHFDVPFKIGDRSLIKDATADDYVKAVWDHYAFQGSVRQLSNTELFETKIGAGRWSRLQHILTTAALTAFFEGTPTQIMQMATHDVAHRVGSHRVDDMLQGRGKENHHDDDLPEKPGRLIRG